MTGDDNVGNIEPDTLPLKDGMTSKDFPVLKHFCIPLALLYSTGKFLDFWFDVRHFEAFKKCQ